MPVRLTDALVAALRPTDRDQFRFDSLLSGYGVRVTPAGIKILIGQGRNGRKVRHTVGRWPALKVAEGRELARLAIADIKAGRDPRHARQQLVAGTGLTITDFAERWMAEHVRVKLKPKTQADYADHLRRHIVPTLGRCTVAGLSWADTNALHVALKDKPPSANRALNILHSLMQYAVRLKLRPDNPCRDIKRYPERSHERYLTPREFVLALEAIDQAERERAITVHAAAGLRLCLFTGARRSEICAAKWTQIDWARQLIRLPDSKTGRPRTIHLNEQAVAILKTVPDVNPFVIAGGPPGQPYTGLSYAWGYARKRRGLTDVRLHDLRHSFASLGLAAGISLPVIGRLLGHAKASSTQRYAHLTSDTAAAATNAIGRAFEDAIANAAAPSATVTKLPRRPRGRR
jgi:integrase